MTLPIILAIAGSVALLVGLFGGGVKAKEIEVPTLARGPRILSSLFGIILIGIAIWLSQTPSQQAGSPTSIPIATTEPASTQIIPAPATNTLTDTPTNTPTNTPTSTPIPKFGWAVYFEQELDEGFWKPGQNSYRIIADCPDTEAEALPDVDNRIEFSVDEGALLFPDAIVELHSWGIPSPNKGEPQLSSINPNQKTKIFLGYVNLSIEQAQQAVNECQVKVIINDQGTGQLSPIGPVPEK